MSLRLGPDEPRLSIMGRGASLAKDAFTCLRFPPECAAKRLTKRLPEVGLDGFGNLIQFIERSREALVRFRRPDSLCPFLCPRYFTMEMYGYQSGKGRRVAVLTSGGPVSKAVDLDR
jgi:hypothetical protein